VRFFRNNPISNCFGGAKKKHNKGSRDRIDGINTEVGYARNEIHDIQLRLDANEQYGRRDTLEIRGIPDIADDDPTQLVPYHKAAHMAHNKEI